ncbi:hypothetical protein DCCM_0686 [Desulfocucumis palustris]|uniref:Uncharacterized protein n=1 Tax=Desulfocucumis palustris TaxID=1898651 RepID=A0A2L2X8Z1_9FIRM|nr:hypothetical protein DCCM_0686 [Desulfocucumis palustris]
MFLAKPVLLLSGNIKGTSKKTKASIKLNNNKKLASRDYSSVKPYIPARAAELKACYLLPFMALWHSI